MLSTIQIATALNLRKHGSGYRGPCPVCGGSDRASKFSVRDGHSRPVWHCFAGCDGDSIRAELQARGVLPKRGERPARSELAHPAQQATHRRQLEAAEEKRTADLATSQAAAGETALALWNRAKPASTHPYLAAKQIPPGSLRRHNDQLRVPITDGKKLVNLQRIHPNGNKRFLKGARIKACYTPVGEVGDTFYIAEGYATAATVQRLTGKAVFAAFTATNLLSVAQTLRARYPRAEIILAADNDHHTPGNPGLTQASRAAAAIGAGLVWPKFPSDHPGSDFNDKCLMAEASAS